MKEALKKAVEAKMEQKRLAREQKQQEAEKNNGSDITQSEHYYKRRKFLAVKDCLCIAYAIRCILGPM